MTENSGKVIPFKKVEKTTKEEPSVRPLSLLEQRDMIIEKIERKRQFNPRRR